MVYKTLKIRLPQPGVCEVWLNRPNRHNAFNPEMIEELTREFNRLKLDTSTRIVVLKGEGNSFCAGADIKWMRLAADYSEEENQQDAYALAEMLRTLYQLPQYTLAVARGNVIGGGIGLVAACDDAIALEPSTFRFSEVALGLTPATISPFVIRKIGANRARSLFVSAQAFDGKTARKLGLVRFLLRKEKDLDKCQSTLIGEVIKNAPGAIADAKLLIDEVANHPINEDLSKITATKIAKRRSSTEGREGTSAFLEKRKPNWIKS